MALALVFSAVLLLIVWVCYLAGVFSVAKTTLAILNVAIPINVLILIVPVFMIKSPMSEKPWFKYFVSLLLIAVITVLNIVMPKHVVLGWALCIFVTNHYYNPRMCKINYAIVLVMMLVAMYGGMFLGEFDAHLLTGELNEAEGMIYNYRFTTPYPSGKSTLVQLFNGLLTPSSGEVNVFDKIITHKKKTKLKSVRRRVGLVFQFPEYQLFEETVLKDVMFGPKNFRLDNIEERSKKAILEVGLTEEIFNESPFSLSGGQMRRVAIAGILASDPDILIFDEPTVGLDPKGKSDLLELLNRLNKEYKKTIIFITHDMEVVGECSSRVIVLDKGNICFDGTKYELFKDSDFVKSHSLAYPTIIRMLKDVKEKLNIDIDIYQYTIEDAYKELSRVLGGQK